MKSESGFSLLEIIIAISIIALFTILPILAYTSYLKKTRDEKRKSDISKVAQALESYKAEKGTYPPDLQSLVSGGFLPDIPTDPLNGQKVPWDPNQTFGYSFSNPDGTTYSLSAFMENGGASGGGGSSGTGAGVLGIGTLMGTFTGTGSGATGGNSIAFTGTVAGGKFTGTFSGSVTGSANGTITGSIPAPGIGVTGTITGSAQGTCTVTGTVIGQTFNGSNNSCNIVGSPGGSIYVATPVNPIGVLIPIATLTQGAQYTGTPAPPTSTPYLSPSVIGTITPTLSPTVTPTNTPTLTPSLTPTNTPTITPTPTPRHCWGINGVCDTACNYSPSGNGGMGVSPVYGTCTGPNSCWNTGSAVCDSSNSANTFKEEYTNSSNCSANYIGHYMSGSNLCAANGSGACYKANGSFQIYNFSSNGSIYAKTFPGGSCAFDSNYSSGGATVVYTPGTATACSYNNNGICGVTLSNMTSSSMKVTNLTTGCDPNGAGFCSKYTVFGTGYDGANNTTNCTSRTYYNSPGQTCTFYAN